LKQNGIILCRRSNWKF